MSREQFYFYLEFFGIIILLKVINCLFVAALVQANFNTILSYFSVFFCNLFEVEMENITFPKRIVYDSEIHR